MDEAANQPAWFQRVVEKESCFPPDVQRRLRALRKIQLRMVILDGEFYREVYNVLAKCHNLYDEFYQRRADIISGAYEPTERDCQWDDEFPDNMKADYSLPSDMAEADAPLHTEDREDPSRKSGEKAGKETVKDEELGKDEASRSEDETCKIGKEKEVDKPTDLAESEKEEVIEERSNVGVSKAEERKEPEETAGLTESEKEEIVKETRTNDEVSKVVEEANEPAGLAEAVKKEITEDKRTGDEEPKIEEVKEAKEPTGLAEGGKDEIAGTTGLAEGRKEEKTTSDEEPKIEEVKGGKQPGGLSEAAKEEMEESTCLAESGKEDKTTSDKEPEEVKGAKQPSGLSEGAKEEMEKSTGLAEGRKEDITEDKRTSDEEPKIEEVKKAKEPVEFAECGKEEIVKTTGLAVVGKAAVITQDKRTRDEVPKIEVKKTMGVTGLAVGRKEDKKTRESSKGKHKRSDRDEEGAGVDRRSSQELKGIPDFWLTIFMNIEILRDLVEERDRPVLSHLIDIRTVYHDEDKPMGFTLEFHFSPNEYFTNTVLTKDYDLILRWHNHDPFVFHGPKMTGCRGCTINWKDGQNVTYMEITKKQTHKWRGTKRTVRRLFKVKSFFDFFSPPLIPDDPDDLDEDSLQILKKDCQVAHYLWDGVNPSPLLFYTGEIWDHDDLDAYYFTEVEGGGDEEV